jgi:hypothetical protein
MSDATDTKKPPRTAPPLYHAIMLEIERRRLQLGISMERLSEIAGIADRAYAKTLHCTAPSGRIAQYGTLQTLIDFLFVDGFTLILKPHNGPRLDELCSKHLLKIDRAFFDRKTRREVMQDYGRKGGTNRFASMTAEEKAALWRRAGIASGRARRRRARERATFGAGQAPARA